MSVPATSTAAPDAIGELVDRTSRSARRRLMITLGAFAALFAYFAVSFVTFDVLSIAQKWSPERASIFLLDTYAYKDHVEMDWDEPGAFEVSFEGGFRQVYETPPAWISIDEANDTADISFPNGGRVIITPTETRMRDWPDGSDLTFARDADGRPFVVGVEPEALPSWVRVTQNKIEVRPSLYERIQVYRSKVEVHRYQVGWGYFWFDFDSPLRDYGFFQAIGLMASSERVDPDRSNASLVLHEFLDNNLWHHGAVLFALVETLLMALLGTMIACIVGLPLAFLAARNITPFAPLRFALRRLFDFLRAIDILIWSLIFLRAFGPGLFTGIFAIAFTDTGTMGKLMSEALENADSKQREGVSSTGASRIQQHRFGMIPQILPIFISQSLYYLESNTRGAVIIGAMGAGGIGLQFLGALQTGSDFENVAYMALLVLALVVFMDTVSASLRRALIGYDSQR